jgi:hypothetical protein
MATSNATPIYTTLTDVTSSEGGAGSCGKVASRSRGNLSFVVRQRLIDRLPEMTNCLYLSA